MSSETYQFQAEINQLMSLIINTFYSNKDIFLRELISNASDAIEKARHQLLVDKKELRDFKINIVPSKENKTLTIEDNGIGMSKEELINNLGTIANSGTKEFMQKIVEEQKADASGMIGQFGVGFYSAYLVSDNVKMYSGKYCWESTAGGTFTITELEEPVSEHGCKMVINMKDDCLNYLEEGTLTDIVHKHSQFIDYPIRLWTVRTESKEVEVEEQKDDENKEGEVEEVKENETKPEKQTVDEVIEEWLVLNKTKPIWLRKDDVTKEEYSAFYKSLTNGWDDHLKVKHFTAEGQVEYKALLYIPKRAPYDMFNNKQKKHNIKLYVKRVLIMDKCEDLMPEWLQFVSGIVDSDDLPLNVSREILQQNSIVKIIKKNLVKKCIDMITEMAEDDDQTDFNQFYEQFSTSIKLGIHEDTKNKERLSKLLRFYSANSKDTQISLQEYIDKMPENQSEIYFITGESKTSVENSPFVKGMVEKGHDVVFMIDPIDEYMCQSMNEFNDKKLVSITKNNAMFHTDNQEYESLCKTMKDILKISNVVVSSRLHNDPCCIVSSEYGWSANMRRIMKAQAMQSNFNLNSMMNSNSQNILEINPNHPMIKKLHEGVTKNTMNEKTLNDIVKLIYETAMVSSGYSHDDPSDFASRIYKIIGIGISVDNDEIIIENVEEGDDNKCELNKDESDSGFAYRPSGVYDDNSRMEEVD